MYMSDIWDIYVTYKSHTRWPEIHLCMIYVYATYMSRVKSRIEPHICAI